MTSSGSLAPSGLAGWLTTRRIAGIAALGYVIGVSIENQEMLQAPTLSSSVDEIRANYADHAFGIATSFAGAIAQVFFVVLVAALYVWLRERDRAGEPWPTIALVGGIASPVIAAAGLAANSGLVAGGALALALWIDPTGISGPSPFDLAPLGGRFAGSWIALLATVCGWIAVRGRVDEARPAAYLLICLPAGALLAALRTIDQLEPAGAAAGYIAVLALLAGAGVAVLAKTDAESSAT